jgi:hypothetical protein
MDYISGLEKIKNLGADIKINENGTMEIAINMSLLSPEEKALALKMKENVSCIKCGKSIPFILAMFNKKSNKPYCPDCSGYCIDVIGNINSTNKNSDIKTTGKVIEGNFNKAKGYDIHITNEQAELLETLTTKATQELLRVFFNEGHKMSEEERLDLQSFILLNIETNQLLMETLGIEIPKQLLDLLNILKPMIEVHKNIVKKKNKKPMKYNNTDKDIN